MPYHPFKQHMEKLDEWGASASKKLVSSRDAGPGMSMTDRLNLARGVDERWSKYQQKSGGPSDEGTTLAPGPEGEDPNNIVPTRSGRVLPPSRPQTFGSTSTAAAASASRPGAPPPPPVRTPSASQAASSATQSGRRPPPPVLPRRMDNEAGIDKPPPPYIPAGKPPAPPQRTPSSTAASSSAPTGLGAVQFSRFDAEQKEEFFALLDEFFASRSQSPAASVTKAPTQAKASANVTSARVLPTERPVPKPASKRKAVPSSTDQSWLYPRLGTSNAGVEEVCSALQCASFFVYRDSYPEWSGPDPWFARQNATPTPLQNRNDLTWSMSKQSMGSDYTLLGSALFSDLSALWWKVSWKSTKPAGTVRVQIAYRDRPEAWNDEERLAEAQKGFGEWIAGFGEQAAQSRQPVGDGECWTLAAEAIKYTNATAQLTEANRLLPTIGRTHGHLIFAGKADPQRGQCGRWRGGDKVRANWGGIRRGDIVEWNTVKIKEKGAPRGSYSTLGAPEHTAIVVDNSPVPDRLSEASAAASPDYYTLLGISPHASQVDVRAGYLRAARQHHPDRAGSSGKDAYMQQLNAANATLSDPASRQRYDEERASGRAGAGRASNASRVSATVDLDAMEVVESANELAFHYPCRCGHGFYVTEAQLQGVARLVVGCSGCSEQIRVVAEMGAGGDDGNDEQDASGDTGEDDQPSIEPWELGSITVIEQSAGQAPTRRTYDLGKDSFTAGEMWVYRPVWESEILGGTVVPSWPPSLPNYQEL